MLSCGWRAEGAEPRPPGPRLRLHRRWRREHVGTWSVLEAPPRPPSASGVSRLLGVPGVGAVRAVKQIPVFRSPRGRASRKHQVQGQRGGVLPLVRKPPGPGRAGPSAWVQRPSCTPRCFNKEAEAESVDGARLRHRGWCSAAGAAHRWRRGAGEDPGVGEAQAPRRLIPGRPVDKTSCTASGDPAAGQPSGTAWAARGVRPAPQGDAS